MKINDLSVGMSYELRKTFCEKDLFAFAELSLDSNPVHLDASYAAQSIFKKQIVHGFLTGSLISAIIGTKMPGPGSIYLHQDMDFRKPVYLGEEVRAVVTVTNIKMEKSIVYLQTNCYNSQNEIVIEGNAIIKLI